MELLITKPDDWHLHLRDQDALATTVPWAAKYFERVIVMPNLKRPVINAVDAKDYLSRIEKYIPSNENFIPLMVIYLTNNTNPQIIKEAAQSKIIHGCKLYPAGATTHSDAGVTVIDKIFPALEAMTEYGLPLLVHGEVTDPHVDIFDREAVFIDKVLSKITKRFTQLKIVFEHISTKTAVDFIREEHHSHLAATITPHHLHYDRNNLFSGGIKPHYYCLPVLKRRIHQEALIKAATSGDKRFFIGTDSAPHAKNQKESACGCAGIFNTPVALSIYAKVFEEHHALKQLEPFLSHHGPDFYGLPRNKSQIKLIKKEYEVPSQLPLGSDIVTPMEAGHKLTWQVIDD